MSLLKNTSKLLLLQYQDYLKNLKTNCRQALKNYNDNYGHLDYDMSDNIYYGYESAINDMVYDIYQIQSNINNYKKGL
jgi:hypothetical protein